MILKISVGAAVDPINQTPIHLLHGPSDSARRCALTSPRDDWILDHLDLSLAIYQPTAPAVQGKHIALSRPPKCPGACMCTRTGTAGAADHLAVRIIPPTVRALSLAGPQPEPVQYLPNSRRHDHTVDAKYVAATASHPAPCGWRMATAAPSSRQDNTHILRLFRPQKAPRTRSRVENNGCCCPKRSRVTLSPGHARPLQSSNLLKASLRNVIFESLLNSLALRARSSSASMMASLLPAAM